MKKVIAFLAATALCLLTSDVQHVWAQRMYWANSEFNTGTVKYANLNGGGSTDITTNVTNVDQPFGIAFDLANRKVYWTETGLCDKAGQKSEIWRADPDGSNPVKLGGGGEICFPASIAVDAQSGHIYWVNGGGQEGAGAIKRANLSDGSGVTTIIAGLNTPVGIALDLTDGELYWSDITDPSTNEGVIQRNDLAGSETTETLVTGASNPQELALDTATNTLYWAEAGALGGGSDGEIRKLVLDGSSSPTTVVSGLNDPVGLAVDGLNSRIYWTDLEPSIGRADLDGSNVQTILTSGVTNPRGIALDPEGVLPVELVAFDAKASGSDVTLTWRTASETNNAGFGIEHQVNGTFEHVGFVNGQGTTTDMQQYRFPLRDLQPGTHAFRLRQVDIDGTTSYSPTVEVTVALDRAYVLSNPYPNPFISTTRLDLTMRTSQHVRIQVYNGLGQHIKTLFDGELGAYDTRTFRLEATDLTSGHYFYRVVGETFTETRTVTLVK